MTKRIRTTQLHNRADVIIYSVPNIPADRLRCPHRGGHSTPAQQRYNKKKSLKRIVLKALNTYTKGSFFIVYTYNDEYLPADTEVANKDMVNVIRATKRLYKKSGIDCQYIGVVECGEKFGRIHCHVLYPYSPEIDFKEIKAKWKKGNVFIKYVPVSQVENWTRYVLKEPVRQTISKNFELPTENVQDISEEEYREIVNNPVNLEKALPGFVVCDVKESLFNGWAASYKKIEIRLKEDKKVKEKQFFIERRWAS